MNKLSKFINALAVLSMIFGITACGEDKTQQKTASSNVLRVGVVPGPYRGMIDKHIRPILKDKGYEIEFVEFTDYVQPDAALDSGEIELNLMQHKKYIDGMIENQHLKIIDVVNVPTLGLGIFSEKYKKLEELPEGAQIGIPADAINLARSLGIAESLGLIKLKASENENKASIADITDNPKKLVFIPMEAAQISRSLDSIAAGFVPGNYAYAANLDYSKALGVENVSETIKNVIAVRDTQKDSLGKVLHDAVTSEQFVKSIEGDKEFDSFTRPAWWPKK
ncbi:MetQ/NlpA family ABC transporter substrate-binding protein [Succinivibrio dextrinosolvens]|uniref:MetQ/NlpA family ABC transporter substrate-binding protein n=1 Tax=Succinivibrio dextrinosolvens TaxID=83771 RepID=UPI001923C596|nr:MetQ/NlpA family ABC transporter substrate-binding protein [Succinivibrio dextrinosolvens]